MYENSEREQDTYLAHFGVKGMKWGVRRYQDKDGGLNTSKSSKRKNKKLAKAFWNPKGNFENRKKLLKKQEAELSKSKEGKAYSQLVKKRGIQIKDKRGNVVETRLSYVKDDWSNPEKVVDQMVKDKNIEYAYRQKTSEIGKKYVDQYRGATLKDLGFKDTKAGREYLKKNNIIVSK